MDNENNQLPDINVGNLNFQPMPKRFMVWDEKGRKFVRGINGHFLNWREIANLVEPSIWDCAVELDEVVERFTIVQSTNLFDKDDKEIFEGSIIDYDGDGAVLGVVVSIDGQWQLKDKYGNLMFLKGAPHQMLVGHILSNPELLQEDNV